MGNGVLDAVIVEVALVEAVVALAERVEVALPASVVVTFALAVGVIVAGNDVAFAMIVAAEDSETVLAPAGVETATVEMGLGDATPVKATEPVAVPALDTEDAFTADAKGSAVSFEMPVPFCKF